MFDLLDNIFKNIDINLVINFDYFQNTINFYNDPAVGFLLVVLSRKSSFL